MDSASITIKTRSLHREYGARNLDPFRGEKNINWEGGFLVPCIVRWPGVIKPGTVINDIVAHWMIDHVFLLLLTQAIVGQFLMSFKEFPPGQRPAFHPASISRWTCCGSRGDPVAIKDPT
jgi:hypothetical protein